MDESTLVLPARLFRHMEVAGSNPSADIENLYIVILSSVFSNIYFFHLILMVPMNACEFIFHETSAVQKVTFSRNTNHARLLFSGGEV